MNAITPHQGVEQEIWNIAEVIEQNAARHPAALALILPDRILSYREFVAAMYVIAFKLTVGGVKAGATVGVSMGQTGLHLLTLFAIARIGAISVPIHRLLPLERRKLAAQRFGVAAIVSGRPDMRIDELPFISLEKIDLSATVQAPPISETRAHDPCCISLSSGTSGDPKGVLRSHGYMLDRVAKSEYERTPTSRLLPMDLNFGVGFGQAMRMLAFGGTVVIAPDNSAANLAYMVRAHAVTHWLLSPALAEEVLALLKDDDVHFPSIVYLHIVGAKPTARLLDALFKKFTPNVYTAYGTVEVGPVSVATPEILRHAPTSAGRLLPWVKAEVVDKHDQPLPAGQPGRLRLKLESMFSDYYEDPTLTSDRFRDGWYYPRDSGWIDSDGLLYISGREDEVYNIAGAKIQFLDVEHAIETHPAVREAAAFVVSGKDGRDILAVAVILRKAVTIAELMQWASSKLGPITPQKIVTADDFPRTATRKVLRDQLPQALATKLS